MKKPQIISACIAAITLLILLAFGRTIPKKEVHSAEDGHKHTVQAPEAPILTSSLSIDSILSTSKKSLPITQSSHLEVVEKKLSAAALDTKVEAYHQLAHFWRDSGKSFIPYAWYTAEGARLENSEKSLTFAGHLFLNALQEVEDGDVRKWMALQAKDLFERSLILNPSNDSSKVGIGATYIFGGISNAPMQGISKIREVVEKDSSNIFGQMTLAMGSLLSGQADKAEQRLETVTRIQPDNMQAILLLAELLEKKGDKSSAIVWYSKALNLAGTHTALKEEIAKRISQLKKER